jgi:hypothetical protein
MLRLYLYGIVAVVFTTMLLVKALKVQITVDCVLNQLYNYHKNTNVTCVSFVCANVLAFSRHFLASVRAGQCLQRTIWPLKQQWQHGTAVDRRANAVVTAKLVTVKAVTPERGASVHPLLSRNQAALTSEYCTYSNIILLFVLQSIFQYILVLLV